MAKVAIPIHGPDHSLGGPDPLRASLPYVYAHDNAGGQTVTADAELDLVFARTNDKETFGWDKAGDPNGLLILRPGLYQAFTKVSYAVGSRAVERSVYAGISTLAGGVLGGLGTEFGEHHFVLGQGQGDGSVGTVEAGGLKSNLEHVGMRPLFGFTWATDPPRIAVILQHPAGDYTLDSGLESSITIIRVGEIGDEPVLPSSLA